MQLLLLLLVLVQRRAAQPSMLQRQQVRRLLCWAAETAVAVHRSSATLVLRLRLLSHCFVTAHSKFVRPQLRSWQCRALPRWLVLHVDVVMLTML